MANSISKIMSIGCTSGQMRESQGPRMAIRVTDACKFLAANSWLNVEYMALCTHGRTDLASVHPIVGANNSFLHQTRDYTIELQKVLCFLCSPRLMSTPALQSHPAPFSPARNQSACAVLNIERAVHQRLAQPHKQGRLVHCGEKRSFTPYWRLLLAIAHCSSIAMEDC